MPDPLPIELVKVESYLTRRRIESNLLFSNDALFSSPETTQNFQVLSFTL